MIEFNLLSNVIKTVAMIHSKPLVKTLRYLQWESYASLGLT